MSQNGLSLEHASDNRKNDRHIILEALKTTPLLVSRPILEGYMADPHFRFVLTNTLDNKDILILCAKKYGRIMEYAPDHYKNDEDIATEAIKNDGYSIQ